MKFCLWWCLTLEAKIAVNCFVSPRAWDWNGEAGTIPFKDQMWSANRAASFTTQSECEMGGCHLIPVTVRFRIQRPKNHYNCHKRFSCILYVARKATILKVLVFCASAVQTQYGWLQLELVSWFATKMLQNMKISMSVDRYLDIWISRYLDDNVWKCKRFKCERKQCEWLHHTCEQYVCYAYS